jgi:hypothetical protein
MNDSKGASPFSVTFPLFPTTDEVGAFTSSSSSSNKRSLDIIDDEKNKKKKKLTPSNTYLKSQTTKFYVDITNSDGKTLTLPYEVLFKTKTCTMDAMYDDELKTFNMHTFTVGQVYPFIVFLDKGDISLVKMTPVELSDLCQILYYLNLPSFKLVVEYIFDVRYTNSGGMSINDYIIFRTIALLKIDSSDIFSQMILPRIYQYYTEKYTPALKVSVATSTSSSTKNMTFVKITYRTVHGDTKIMLYDDLLQLDDKNLTWVILQYVEVKKNKNIGLFSAVKRGLKK